MEEWEGLGHARIIAYFHYWFVPLRSPQILALPSRVPKKRFPGGGEGCGIAGFWKDEQTSEEMHSCSVLCLPRNERIVQQQSVTFFSLLYFPSCLNHVREGHTAGRIPCVLLCPCPASGSGTHRLKVIPSRAELQRIRPWGRSPNTWLKWGLQHGVPLRSSPGWNYFQRSLTDEWWKNKLEIVIVCILGCTSP